MSGKFTRPSWDEYFMLQAELAKLRSNCLVRQVGAVIVRDHRQIATGYNGTPPGIKNCCDGGCERCLKRVQNKIKPGEHLGRCLCTHAEANAIMHCAILGIDALSGKDTTLYTTYTPCLECTKLAITVGIKRFVCLADYVEDAEHLRREGSVVVEKMSRDRILKWVEKLSMPLS